MISNSQLDEISRIYESRRILAEEKKTARTEEVVKAIPAIKEINDTLIENSFKALRMSFIDGNDSALDNLRSSNRVLIKTKQSLLAGAGYPVDYLDDVYLCPECRDTGFIKDRDGVIISRCRCYTKTVIERFYMTKERKELLNRENFHTFNTDLYDTCSIDEESGISDYDTMTDSVNRALDFVDEFKNSYSNLLISGKTGTGKTFLANCIAKKLIDMGVSVLYLPANDFFEYCKKSQFSQGEESKNAGDELNFITNAECLVIDDLGSEMSNSFTNNQLFVLLEKRDLKKLHTVITTNLNRPQIQKRYSDRIYSRLFAGYSYLRMPGSDNRLKQKNNDFI